MSVYNNVNYIKPGANFADAATAQADKSQYFSPELKQQIDDCFAKMLVDGVLLEPVAHAWNQSTHTLTTVKHVSSREAYNAAVSDPATGFNTEEVITLSEQAGWTYSYTPPA